ncbi:MAG: DUF1887 family CARF protein [Caldilineaceae bacterium]
MQSILISLVGHQPLPSLLAVRHLKPDMVMLLASKDHDSRKRYNNLLRILRNERKVDGSPLKLIDADIVDEWSMSDVIEKIECALEDVDEIAEARIICDVTGGTKTMSIGLVHFAKRHQGDVVYIASDKLHTRMLQFDFDLDRVGIRAESECPIARQIEIIDLFKAYLGFERLEKKSPRTNQNNPGPFFERDVGLGFAQFVDKQESSVLVVSSGHEEADWVLQKQNHFAIVECKVNSDMIGGMRQLNNMASERYLGTYTAKILAIKDIKAEQYNDYMALADQHNIHVLHLPEWNGCEHTAHRWSDVEITKFEDVVRKAFHG